jgi:hypothetical protein
LSPFRAGVARLLGRRSRPDDIRGRLRAGPLGVLLLAVSGIGADVVLLKVLVQASLPPSGIRHLLERAGVKSPDVFALFVEFLDRRLERFQQGVSALLDFLVVALDIQRLKQIEREVVLPSMIVVPRPFRKWTTRRWSYGNVSFRTSSGFSISE